MIPVRLIVGGVFLSEGVQKFLFPDTLPTKPTDLSLAQAGRVRPGPYSPHDPQPRPAPAFAAAILLVYPLRPRP